MALSSLTQFILDQNPYFNTGFDDVYQDETTGIVHNNEPIFPADNLGNYFYLRLPNNITFDNSTYYTVEECANTPGLVYSLILVASVRDSDKDILLSNMLSTLGKFGGITLSSATNQNVVVVLQELSNMSEEARNKALQNTGVQTLVSVSFTYTEQMPLNNCVEPTPCTC